MTAILDTDWEQLGANRQRELARQTLRRHLGVAGITAARRLREVIASGTIHGGTYWSEVEGCGCVVGWLYSICEKTHAPLELIVGRTQLPKKWRLGDVIGDDALNFDVDPLEYYIINVRPGDTAETSEVVRDILNWTDEWLDNDRARGKPRMTITETQTPAEAAFREAVRRVHLRGDVPTPARVLRELGRHERAKSRDIGGPLLNGRESKWRVNELKLLGYEKDEWSGRWSREGQNP